MQGLIASGLRGVEYIVSDDHSGLGAARKALFSGVPWQRCEFHLAQNAQNYASKTMNKSLTKIRKHLRTSNLCERINIEIARRTRVIRIFPNEASCLRMVSAILMEVDEEWISGKKLFVEI